MKTKAILVTLSTGLLGAAAVAGSQSAQVSADILQQLHAVPSLEMPAKAVELVKAANPADRADMAARVVESAARLNEVATPAVVAAISRSMPEVAPMAAAAAAAVHPKLTPSIVYAASLAAPDQAGKITAGVCQVTPGIYDVVASYAVEAAPTHQDKILSSLTQTIPEATPAIEQARSEAKAKSTTTDLRSLLGRAKEIQLASYSSSPAPAGLAPLSSLAPITPAFASITPQDYSIRSALTRLDISLPHASQMQSLIEPLGPTWGGQVNNPNTTRVNPTDSTFKPVSGGYTLNYSAP